MTTKSIRFALATAGAVAAMGAVAVAGAASHPASNANTTPPGQYGKDQCADGKWQTYKNPDGSQKFKNRGQCQSFFVHASH